MNGIDFAAALRNRVIRSCRQADLPAPSSVKKGALVFVVDANGGNGEYRYSTGNAWLGFGGGGGSGIQLREARATFTAADLNFNTDESDRIILQCPQEKIINPVSIWGKIEWPGTGAELPQNNDGFEIGLHGFPANQKMMKVGTLPVTAFSTSFKNTYYPCMGDNVNETFVNQQVANIEACSLKLRCLGITGAPNNHHGGNYTVKFRVLYELADAAAFI